MSFWRTWRGGGKADDYEIDRLIDTRTLDQETRGGFEFICDIDKTYLETEFESLIKLVRIAFESASDKVAVTGAADVLLAARWGDTARAVAPPPRPLHFVSSSPPQLRAVLEEKLALDGLDWSTDTFKNQAYNLRMGRMDQLKQHVAYKSLAILRAAAGAGPGGRLVMLGDNAESDGYIYLGILLVLAGRLGREGYRHWLTEAGVDALVAERIVDSVPVPPAAQVHTVLIRNVPGYQAVGESPLTDPLLAFDSYFEAALLLIARGVVGADRLWPLARVFHNRHGMTAEEIVQAISSLAGVTGLPEAVRAAALATCGRLGQPLPAAGSRSALAEGLEKDLTRFLALPEPEILALGRQWRQRLLERHQREQDGKNGGKKGQG